MTTPSPRHAAALAIEAHLRANERTWDAPYGIMPSLRYLPRGGALRTISFGQRRTLDAQVAIWSPSHIEITGHGPLMGAVGGYYHAVAEVLEALRAIEGSGASEADSTPPVGDEYGHEEAEAAYEAWAAEQMSLWGEDPASPG